MKRVLVVTILVLVGRLFAQAPEADDLPKFVRFHHYQQNDGETVRITVRSHSGKGTLQVEDAQGGHAGKVRVDWDQMIDRTEYLEAGVKKLRYRVLADKVVTSVVLDGKKNVTTTESPLVGETVEGMQDSLGQWRLFLDHLSGTEQTRMIEELETYESRQWFVAGAVRVGDSWPFQPSFIRHMMERDLKGAQLDASMTLAGIERIDGVPVAKLAFTILSKGAKAEADASIFLRGTVAVDLRNMLDYHTQMDGYLHTEAEHNGVHTKIKIPLHFTVKQSITKQLR